MGKASISHLKREARVTFCFLEVKKMGINLRFEDRNVPQLLEWSLAFGRSGGYAIRDKVVEEFADFWSDPHRGEYIPKRCYLVGTVLRDKRNPDGSRLITSRVEIMKRFQVSDAGVGASPLVALPKWVKLTVPEKELYQYFWALTKSGSQYLFRVDDYSDSMGIMLTDMIEKGALGPFGSYGELDEER